MAMYNYHDGREVPQYYYYPWWSDLAPVTFLDPRHPEVYWRDDRYMDDRCRFLYHLQDNAGDPRRPEVYWRDGRYMDDRYRFLYRLRDNAGDTRRPEVCWRDGRYMDDEYRFHYRLQDNAGDHSHHGHMPQEQVVRRNGAAPWWLDHEYPCNGGYVGMYHLPPWEYESRVEDSTTEVEMYVPLCCDECVRKVRKHLKNMEGVESVVADQWEKKVVVVGRNLQPDVLLRRMQRDKPGSVFWSDRSN